MPGAYLGFDSRTLQDLLCLLGDLKGSRLDSGRLRHDGEGKSLDHALPRGNSRRSPRALEIAKKLQTTKKERNPAAFGAK